MKILFVNYEFPPIGGGGGVGTYQIANKLSETHKVSVLTSGFDTLPKFQERDGVDIHRVPVLWRKDKDTATLFSMLSFFPSSLWKGIKLLRKEKPDVINSHFAIPSGFSGILLSKLFKIPHVLTIIGGDIYDPSKRLSPHKNIILKNIARYVMNNSEGIIAISEDVKNRAIEYYGIKRDITVIPYGLEEIEFEKTTRKELNLSESDFLIITICRLIKRKNLQQLIKAIQGLREPFIKLLIIGEGPEKKNLKNLSKKLNIESQIIFLGPLWGKKKYQYLSISDLFALPSLHEGFGIVFLEAMSIGLPILTTNKGGQTDFVKEGINGYLIRNGDVEGLAERIEQLKGDNKLRREISKNNLEDVHKYHISNTVKKYEAFFKSLAR